MEAYDIILTAYEKRLERDKKIIWAAAIVWLVGFAAALITAGAVSGARAVITALFICILVALGMAIVFLIYALTRKKLKYQHAQIYSKLDADSQYNVYFPLSIVIKGGRKDIKSRFAIDKTGMRNDQFSMQWKDYKLELAAYKLMGQVAYSINLISLKGDSAITFPLDIKTFYLVQKFSGQPLKQAQDIEKMLKSHFGIIPKDKPLHESAKVFYSHFGLFLTGVILAMVGITIGLLVAAIYLSVSLGIVVVIIFALGVATAAIMRKLPRGKTYISHYEVFNVTLTKVTEIDIARAKMEMTKRMIIFQSAAQKVILYRNKDTEFWTTQCVNEAKKRTENI